MNAHCQDVRVHRMVAFAFLGPPPSDHQTLVNHKDLNKGNNAAHNLEWVSPSENQAHFVASSTLRHGPTTAKPVWSRPHGMENHGWRWHHSVTNAANDLGLHRTSVSKCMRGLLRQTGGFEFCLAAEPKTYSPLPGEDGEEWRDVSVYLLERDREIRLRTCQASRTNVPGRKSKPCGQSLRQSVSQQLYTTVTVSC